MDDIMKELTVGELLALDETGETSFEIAQHESGSVMISVRRNGRAVMIRLGGDYIGAGHGESLTKEKLLAMIGDSIRKTKQIDERGATIGESKNPGAAEDTES